MVCTPNNTSYSEDEISPDSNLGKGEFCTGRCDHLNSTMDYFKMSSHPWNDSVVFPHQTFTNGPVAFHLNYDLAVRSIGVGDVAKHYLLPDLQAALVHYIYCKHNGHPIQIGGQRHFCSDENLPFNKLQVWKKVHLQQRAYHDSMMPLAPQTLNMHLPMADWPKGCYDAAFANINRESQWPWSGLEGPSFY